MTEDDEPSRALDGLPPATAVLWSQGGARARPGRRPGLTLAGIAEAGVAVADAEGLEGLSMARVAERLGVTTMALYRYVASKDELLALMYDTALPAPGSIIGSSGDQPWRERLEAWCRAQLDLVRRHPWVVQLAGLPPIGPSRVAWLEHGLEALDGTGLPHDLRVAVVGMLSLHTLTEGQLIAAQVQQQRGEDAGHPALVDYGTVLRAVVDPVTHPRVTEALAAGAFDDEPPGAPADGTAGGEAGGHVQHFEEQFALQILLDGVEALVARWARGES